MRMQQPPDLPGWDKVVALVWDSFSHSVIGSSPACSRGKTLKENISIWHFAYICQFIVISFPFHWICRYVLLCHAIFSNSGRFLGSCFRYRSNAYMYQFTHTLVFQISIIVFHKELHTPLWIQYSFRCFSLGWHHWTLMYVFPRYRWCSWRGIFKISSRT